MTLIPLEAALGMSTGYTYALSKRKEDEVRQGENHYQASMFQWMQVTVLSDVTKVLARAIPNASLRLAATVSSAALPYFSVILLPFSAAVKQGHYKTVAKKMNEIAPQSLAIIPKKLSQNSTQLISMISQYSGDAARIGIFASAAALPFIGQTPLAVAMIVPLGYESLDAKGLIPQRISLFLERYMPAVSDLTFLAAGGLVMRVISAVSLITEIPASNRTIHRQIDQFAHRYMRTEGPTIEEIDAPLIVRKDLTYAEMKEILESDREEFEANPAHCSKWAYHFAQLSRDYEFGKFLDLFNEIDWTGKYNLLLRSFQDDDRFLSFIREKFPESDDPQTHIERYITMLAEEEGKTKEEYLAGQLREQLVLCIQVLQFERPVKGMKQDLDTAIENCSQILCYLYTLNPISDAVEIEDILLKIGMECGDYCARGIKRASTELLSGILLQGVDADPIRDYEIRMLQRLEQERLRILEKFYLCFMDIAVQGVKNKKGPPNALFRQATDKHTLALAQDVHTMDIYRTCLALGFYPLTEYERDSFGLFQLYMWRNTFSQLRSEMYNEYQMDLDSVIREMGEVNFGAYFGRILSINPNLSDEQQESLMDLFLELPLQRFHQLVFYMLGILRRKEIWDQWKILEVEEDQADDLSDWSLI